MVSKQLDARREAVPAWVQSQQMVGGMWPLHLFQQFCKTIIGLIDSFFHATLERSIAVSD